MPRCEEIVPYLVVACDAHAHTHTHTHAHTRAHERVRDGPGCRGGDGAGNARVTEGPAHSEQANSKGHGGACAMDQDGPD